MNLRRKIIWHDYTLRGVEEVAMAEVNKLSVGKVLEKLRRNDAPEKSKIMQLDEKTKTIDEEIERLRTAGRRLGRAQPARTIGRD